jgi:hypothetical protein
MTPRELAVLLRRLDELKARSPGGRGMTWSASTTGCCRPPRGRRDPGRPYDALRAGGFKARYGC